MIHEELYQSENLERINIRDYLTNLMNYLFRSYNLKSSNIMWSLQSPDIAMNIEYALPCGLILTELVSNSFKYAFSRRTKGEIKVQLKKEGHCIYFIISDNGIGLPSGVDIAESETLGFQLVYNLVQQLRGQIRIRREEGTEFEIHFKEPEIQS
jgi:two-component sensor histidine kinase